VLVERWAIGAAAGGVDDGGITLLMNDCSASRWSAVTVIFDAKVLKSKSPLACRSIVG